MLKNNFVIAKYIGPNHSMGFATGRKYELRLESTDNQIKVTSRGVVLPEDEMIVPYDSEEAFLNEWEIITILK